MFIQLLLSVLSVHLVLSTTNLNNNNNVKDFDGFIAFMANPAKDPFDWSLLQKVTAAKGHQNVIISPISLKLIMAILYEGSAGNTQKEFKDVLKFPSDVKDLRQQYSNFLSHISHRQNNYIVNIGSRLFLDNRLTVEQKYGSTVKSQYETEVASTNFSNTHQASIDINSWVDVVTNGRIKTLVTPDDLENAVLIATNAIYFKGLWRTPFPKDKSFKGDFHLSNGETVKADYMTITDIFDYGTSKSLGAHVLRLPYLGRKFGFYILLPYNKDGLADLIKNIDLKELTSTVRFMAQKNVSVVMPKFKFDFESKYAEILRDFGFYTLFSSSSSLPGILRNQQVQLVVKDVLQKSGIDVNEEGSVIYAATQVSLGNKFGVEPIETFNMTHPFLFFIIDEASSQEILFIGKVENPVDNSIPSRFGSSGPQFPPVYQVGPSQTQVPEEQYNPQGAASTNYPQRISNFDIELLKNSIGSAKNVLISPASIKVSLAMLADASADPTANQIYDVLGTSATVLQGLVNELSDKAPHSELRFENALFVSDVERVKSNYKFEVERKYKALLKQLNFNDKNRAAAEINYFISNATSGSVSAALSPDEIDHHTKILLTNILYFKGDWLKIFELSLTRPACFHAPTGCVNVPLMHMIEMFEYWETPNAQIVKLPYTGYQRAMLLVVPKSEDSLIDALKDIEAQSFNKLLSKLNTTEVELYLPKFEINYSQNIVNTLRKMDIRQVFDTNANLVHLLEGDKQNFVDSFVHKTKIEVTEEGTEASAISLVSVIPLMGTSTPIVRADRPFAFFIYNTVSNNILFEGVLKQPENKVDAVREKTVNPNILNYPQNRFPNNLEQRQEILHGGYLRH